MSDQMHRPAHPREAVFLSKSQPLDSRDVKRAVRRMAHEVVERNQDMDRLVVIGLQTGGVSFAQAIADVLEEIGDAPVARGVLDVAFYRDDLALRPISPRLTLISLIAPCCWWTTFSTRVAPFELHSMLFRTGVDRAPCNSQCWSTGGTENFQFDPIT